MKKKRRKRRRFVEGITEPSSEAYESGEADRTGAGKAPNQRISRQYSAQQRGPCQRKRERREMLSSPTRLATPSKTSGKCIEGLCSVSDGSSVLIDALSPSRNGGKKRALEFDPNSKTPPRPHCWSPGGGTEYRFIPNRAKLDENLSHYLMAAHEALPTSPSKGTTPSHQKLRQELSLLSPTEGKRMMDCRKSLTPQFERTSSVSLFKVSSCRCCADILFPAHSLIG